MTDLQVRCVTKTQATVSAITHLGGDGWNYTRAKVIELINGRTHRFYTVANGYRAFVEVVAGANGPYLRTQADGTPNDNLLKLPACAA